MVTDNFAIGFFFFGMKTVRLRKKRIEDGQTRINDMSNNNLKANISNLDTTDIFFIPKEESYNKQGPKEIRNK